MTTQPALPPADSATAEALIEPHRYRPPGVGPELPRPRIPWLGALGLLVLVTVVWAAWFVLTARSVGLVTQPENAAVSVLEWPAPRVGNHWLLRAGKRHVRVEAPGYVSFDGDIEVSDAQLQTHEIVLTRLPGHLRVQVTPVSRAEVIVDGAVLGDAPGLISDVPPGYHEIEIRADRFLSFHTGLEIEGKGIEQAQEVRLEPAWADVSVDAQPRAKLLVDREAVGQTPLTTELLAGRRVLELVAPGYKRWKQTLKITAGQPVDLGEVVLQKADGRLQLGSTPAGANVTVDGEFVGRTPLDIAVTPDATHRIELSREGYKPAREEASIASGKRLERHVELTPELASIRLETVPPEAELLVNGEPRGSASQTLSLPTHEHELTVRARGYATYQTRVTPRKGVEKRFRIRLKTAAEAAQSPAAGSAARAGAAGAERSRARGRVKGFVKTHAGQEMKLFNGGDVTLGSSRGSAGHQANEVLRPVRLARPFYLAVKEVTNTEFRLFLANHSAGEFNGQALDNDSQAVANVSWSAAALYCNWLSRRDSLPPFYQIRFGEVLGVNPAATGYRLPTEAEWEWAARVPPQGKPLNLPWGGKYPPRERAENYADTTASAVVGETLSNYTDGFAVSAPVGSFQPNLNGLYDMGGNVAEWVHDYYDAAPPARPVVDPLGPATGAAHVIKGASWAQSSLTALRLSFRDFGDAARDDVGFRLARYAQ